MYDAGKIIVGLVIFLVLVTSPLWYNAISSAPVDEPELNPVATGQRQKLTAKSRMSQKLQLVRRQRCPGMAPADVQQQLLPLVEGSGIASMRTFPQLRSPRY